VSEPPGKSVGERILETVDADLEAVTQERLPDSVRQVAMATLLGGIEVPYVTSFEMGYKWARQAQMFAVANTEMSEELERIAIGIRDKSHEGLLPSGKRLASAVLLAPNLQFITNEDANPYADANEASAVSVQQLLDSGVRLSTGAAPDRQRLGNAFSAGATLWAVETQILLHLRQTNRVEQVEQWRKRERIPVIGWWLARRRERRWAE